MGVERNLDTRPISVPEFIHAIGLNPTIHVHWFIHTYYDVRGGRSSLGKRERFEKEQGLKSLNPFPSLILFDCGK